MKDAKLQKQMQAAAAKNDFGDVPLRVVIVDDAFEYERAYLTGVILSRTIHTAVATKGKDGTCMVRYIQMTQQAVGKKFDAPQASMPSDESAIRCENVNKERSSVVMGADACLERNDSAQRAGCAGNGRRRTSKASVIMAKN